MINILEIGVYIYESRQKFSTQIGEKLSGSSKLKNRIFCIKSRGFFDKKRTFFIKKTSFFLPQILVVKKETSDVSSYYKSLPLEKVSPQRVYLNCVLYLHRNIL